MGALVLPRELLNSSSRRSTIPANLSPGFGIRPAVCLHISHDGEPGAIAGRLVTAATLLPAPNALPDEFLTPQGSP